MAECGFPRASRLLNAADYTAVFSNAQFKVSCRHFLILALRRGRSPRLGMVVAKKHVAKAVQRNRLKRVIRESFRHHLTELGSVDLIVLVRGDADTLANALLYGKLAALWKDLAGKINRQPEASSNS